LPQSVTYRVGGETPEQVSWHCARLESDAGNESEVVFTATVRDISLEQVSNQALSQSQERLHLAMEAGRLAIYEIDLTSGRLTGSAELNRLYGLPVDARPTLADLRSHYAPGELERLENEGVTYERARSVLRDQGSRTEHDRAEPARFDNVEAELTIITKAGVTKHLDYRAQYVRGNDGVPSRLIGILVDVSDRKRAEDRLSVVASELHHRIKNALAIVQAMASQTFRSGESVELSLPVFLARLHALDAATAALLEKNADQASVNDIVERITAPYRSAQSNPFSVRGDDVLIAGKLVTSVAMTLHELSTNAIKHGALSRPEGRVSLSWMVTDEKMLELRWEEKGGPPVTPPTRKGFGTRLLSSLIPNGSVVQDFAPGGLVCVVRCSLSDAH
jgi:two-component sensor histidine kinase